MVKLSPVSQHRFHDTFVVINHREFFNNSKWHWWEIRARIFKRLWSPGIDSKDRAGMITLFVLPARQATYAGRIYSLKSIPRLLNESLTNTGSGHRRRWSRKKTWCQHLPNIVPIILLPYVRFPLVVIILLNTGPMRDKYCLHLAWAWIFYF